VAPLTIGDGAYTAAGSVITEDVPPGALGIARGRQHNSAGWVERQRAGRGSAAAAARARQAAQPEAGGPEAPAANEEDKGVEGTEGTQAR
jgi:bifunctional UDP-N-acetylglucosamine pyrophosphorylase/glucosamine-1-phosphate N-acetyltransferase